MPPHRMSEGEKLHDSTYGFGGGSTVAGWIMEGGQVRFVRGKSVWDPSATRVDMQQKVWVDGGTRLGKPIDGGEMKLKCQCRSRHGFLGCGEEWLETVFDLELVCGVYVYTKLACLRWRKGKQNNKSPSLSLPPSHGPNREIFSAFPSIERI